MLSARSNYMQIEEAKHMLEHKYVAKAKSAGVKQRIEVITFSTDVESVGQVVTTRAKELNAAAVVRIFSHSPLDSNNTSKFPDFDLSVRSSRKQPFVKPQSRL